MAVTELAPRRRRNRVGERERANLLIERKAAAMPIVEVIAGLRTLYSDYAVARNAYFACLGSQPRSVSELAQLKMEHDRCDFRLRFALGVDIFGPRLHEARAHGWLTADIKILRAVGIVG